MPALRRILVSLAVLAAAAFYWWPDRPPAKKAEPAPAAETAELSRQDMTTTTSLPGTLGYGAARPIAGGGAGIVTWMPQPGRVVKRGQQVYRVDDRPVPLFYGSLPMYRPLQARDTVGRDVRVLADNLRALGYSIGPRPKTTRAGDGVLTESLIAAVKRWQRDTGLPATGAVSPADVVVQRGAVRVDSVTVEPGVAAEGPLMSVTPTAKVITVQAEAAQVAGVERGDEVSVDLPGAGPLAAEVTAVGTQLKTPEGDTGDAPPLIAVTVTVKDQKKLGRIDSADVEVAFAGEVREDVLVAPVTALVALSEGGYALQVEGGALVAVKTGMFAKGMVEVKGDGLDEGTRVLIAS